MQVLHARDPHRHGCTARCQASQYSSGVYALNLESTLQPLATVSTNTAVTVRQPYGFYQQPRQALASVPVGSIRCQPHAVQPTAATAAAPLTPLEARRLPSNRCSSGGRSISRGVPEATAPQQQNTQENGVPAWRRTSASGRLEAGQPSPVPAAWRRTYELCSDDPVLGGGAFAEVFKVRHKSTQQSFALKVMNRPNFALRGIAKQIEAEVRAMQLAASEVKGAAEHVVRLLDVVEEDDYVYLLLELCGQGDLLRQLQVEPLGRFTEEAVAVWARQLFLGLDILHANGIIHRDIKPDNLLCTEEGVLKIADFGWCAEVCEAPTALAGTFQYMAPEVLQNHPQTEKVDVWSSGVALYQMLAGRPLLSTYLGPGATQLTMRDPHEATALKQKWLLEEIFSSCPPTRDIRPDGLSNACWDFLCHVLEPQARHRCSVVDALKHPWLADVALNAQDNIQNSGEAAVQKFAAEEKPHLVDQSESPQQIVGAQTNEELGETSAVNAVQLSPRPSAKLLRQSLSPNTIGNVPTPEKERSWDPLRNNAYSPPPDKKASLSRTPDSEPQRSSPRIESTPAFGAASAKKGKDSSELARNSPVRVAASPQRRRTEREEDNNAAALPPSPRPLIMTPPQAAPTETIGAIATTPVLGRLPQSPQPTQPLEPSQPHQPPDEPQPLQALGRPTFFPTRVSPPLLASLDRVKAQQSKTSEVSPSQWWRFASGDQPAPEIGQQLPYIEQWKDVQRSLQKVTDDRKRLARILDELTEAQQERRQSQQQQQWLRDQVLAGAAASRIAAQQALQLEARAGAVHGHAQESLKAASVAVAAAALVTEAAQESAVQALEAEKQERLCMSSTADKVPRQAAVSPNTRVAYNSSRGEPAGIRSPVCSTGSLSYPGPSIRADILSATAPPMAWAAGDARLRAASDRATEKGPHVVRLVKVSSTRASAEGRENMPPPNSVSLPAGGFKNNGFVGRLSSPLVSSASLQRTASPIKRTAILTRASPTQKAIVSTPCQPISGGNCLGGSTVGCPSPATKIRPPAVMNCNDARALTPKITPGVSCTATAATLPPPPPLPLMTGGTSITTAPGSAVTSVHECRTPLMPPSVAWPRCTSPEVQHHATTVPAMVSAPPPQASSSQATCMPLSAVSQSQASPTFPVSVVSTSAPMWTRFGATPSPAQVLLYRREERRRQSVPGNYMQHWA